MNTIGKIVGINLVILVLYYIGLMFILGFENELEQALYLGFILIPSHFLLCLIISTVKYFKTKGSGERNLVAKGYLLSAIVVVIVGFSACMAMIL